MDPLQFDKYFDTRNEIADFGPRFFVRTRAMEKYLKGLSGRLLDAGCGEGNFLKFLVNRFAGKFDYTGIDVSKKAIHLAEKKLAGQATLIAGEIYAISPKKKFDVIVCGEVLEHIENDEKFIKKLSMLTQKGGFAVLSVPLDKKLWSEYDTDAGHFRRYEKKELFDKLENAGFKVKNYTVWGFPLMRLLYGKISKKNKELSEKKRINLGFLFFMRFARHIFLIDRFFNFTEKGIGIIVLAQKT